MTPYPIEIEDVNAATARARLVGGVLRIKLPRHWPPAYKDQTIQKFQRWAQKQARVAESLPEPEDSDGRTWTGVEFDAYVRQLNAETLQVPVAGVRIGSARASRLAQANTHTRILTFSRFAINGMPLRALRYLALHELAHLIEANHSARFWALVAAHEPDYKRQRAIAQAHHARACEREAAGAVGPELAVAAHAPAPAVMAMASTEPDPEHHLFDALFTFLPAGL